MIESSEFMSSSNPSSTKASKNATNKANASSNLDDSLLDTEKANPLLQLLKLPRPILKRVKALKNLQLKMVDIESGFYDELHQLECKYMQKYEGLFEKRRQIVNGEYEPNEEEAKWEYDDVLGEEEVKEGGDATPNTDVNSVADGLKSVNLDKEEGIPGFWLQSFKSSDLLCEMMQPHDELVLQHLRDIKIVMHEKAPIGYTIEFYFNKNEYFTNEKLTKTYGLTTEKDKKDPLSYDGPVFYRCQGCTINWNKDKNVTVKLIKKKQKHKSSGQVRIINKEEKQDSFFNFFETPTPDGIRPSFKTLMNEGQEAGDHGEEDDDEMDEENENLYEADFEIGHFFKEVLSLLFFLRVSATLNKN